jgi:hypothetical protein
LSDLKLAERRERGMNDLAAVIQATYGERCSRREGGCTSCTVWAIFDALDTMTDASVFADDWKHEESGDTAVAVTPTV